MCIAKSLPTVREILNAESNTAMVGCLTGWVPVTGVDTLRISWAVRALSGSISVVPVIQYAKVRTDRPEDWAAATGATARTQEGDSFVEVDISGDSDDYLFFRVGLQYTENSGAGHADCRLAVTYQCEGEIVARQTIDLQPQGSGTEYIPITGALPAVAIAKVKAAFLFTGGSNAEYGLGIRTFSSDDEEGGAWSTIGSLYDPSSDDYDEHVLTDTSISTTLANKMYYQLAIACTNPSAGSAYGRLTVLAAVRGS